VLSALVSLFAFLFGAAVGSFVNVCIYRLPRRLSLVQPPSHCPHCGMTLTVIDLVPLLSYLWLGGKCRHCKTPISPRYFLVELLTALLFMATVHRYPLGMEAVLVAASLAALVVIAFVDWEFFLVPDEAVWALAIFGIVRQVITNSWLGLGLALGGAVVASVLIWLVGILGRLIFRKEAMGFGDVKIYAALLARQVPAGFFRKDNFAFRTLPRFAGLNLDDLLFEWDTQADWRLSARLFGSDISPKHIAGAQQNAERALVADTIEWRVMDAAELPHLFPKESVQCLLTNPPFGIRSGSLTKARQAHRLLVEVADQVLDENGRLVVITHHPEWLEVLAPSVGLKEAQRYEVLHGDLPAAILVLRRQEAARFSLQTEVHEA